MLYLYCWIMNRTYRLLSTDLNSERRVNKRIVNRSALASLEQNLAVTHDGADASYEDTVSGNTNDDNARAVHDDHSLIPIRNTAVPVAQMLPRQPDRDVISVRPGKLQRAARDIAPLATAGDEGPDLDEDSDNDDVYVPPNLAPRAIKRRGGYSMNQPEPLANKRQKGFTGGSTSDTGSPSPRAVRPRHTSVGTNSKERCDTTSYPSPPAAQQETPGDMANTRNFPNIGRTDNTVPIGQALRDASDAGDKVPDAPASTKETQQEDLVESADVENDNDSVQGDEEAPPIGTESVHNISSATEPVRSTEPTTHTAQSRDTEDIRRSLFSNLWGALPAGLQRSNTPLLSSTVHILESLSELDYLRLREIYADGFDSHHAALNEWVKSLKSILAFYELTNFQGDLSTLDAFLADLPYDTSEPAIQIIVQGGPSLFRWPSDARFSNEVTSVLYNLVVPQRFWKSNMMENKTQKFTEGLLAWFR
jgi:hypothetical protein